MYLQYLEHEAIIIVSFLSDDTPCQLLALLGPSKVVDYMQLVNCSSISSTINYVVLDGFY